jgi:Glycosyl hydrolase family 14
MLPLDAWSPDCEMDLATALPRLAAVGIRGIMVDVWWGVCEKSPREYDFSPYKRIAEICRDSGLAVQATISLHACGGNIGDSVNIPLPDWVVEAGDEHGMWYLDRQGYAHRECLSLSADKVKVLPTRLAPSEVTPGENKEATAATTVDGNEVAGEAPKEDCAPSDEAAGEPETETATATAASTATATETDPAAPSTEDQCRTPLEAYEEFINAFLVAIGDELLRSTVVELQVGCGPCGELRYPSYPLGSSMWKFPGMGELQCFDSRMLEDLKSSATAQGHPPDWGVPPEDTGTYNAAPRESSFFRRGYATPRGTFFLAWYSNAMLEHGRNMLDVASAALGRHALTTTVTLAVKVSGIHWWKLSSSRAAESAAGYYVSKGHSSYANIATLLRDYNAVLDFTCLEMRTCDQPFLKARCGPRQLVGEVFKAASKASVRVAGENALERYDWCAYAQILKAFRSMKPGGAYGFTLLRLGPTLLETENLITFEKFVKSMKEI